MEISGRLAAFSPAELLQWAHNERRTGSLVVRRSQNQKRIYFRDGEVVACYSDDPADYYGQHLLLYGYLSESSLVDALSYCTRKNKRLGLALAELGLLSEEEVSETLNQQIQDSICGLFLWRQGVFYFEAAMPAHEEILPRPIRTIGLVMEGTRWMDEMARFRKIFPSDNVVLRRGPAWPGNGLGPVENRIVTHVDGERTLGQIHGTIRGSYFRVVEGAYNLCLKEVLDMGRVGEARESTTMELSVYDLLLEQAVEEEVTAREREPRFPLGVLAGYHPVWIDPPTDEELGTLSESLRTFSASIDGERTLRDLLPRGEKDLGQMELLLAQLKKGALALLPAAPADFAALMEKRSQGEESVSWWRRFLPHS